jgi:hypothetical protein
MYIYFYCHVSAGMYCVQGKWNRTATIFKCIPTTLVLITGGAPGTVSVHIIQYFFSWITKGVDILTTCTKYLWKYTYFYGVSCNNRSILDQPMRNKHATLSQFKLEKNSKINLWIFLFIYLKIGATPNPSLICFAFKHGKFSSLIFLDQTRKSFHTFR